jgi:hypothetical protein
MADRVSSLNPPTVLQRLIGLLMTPMAPVPIEQVLPVEMHSVARATYFLLDVGGRCEVETFITYTLNRLLRQLSHNTMQRPVIYRKRVRGRILWPATYKARYGDDYDPSRYVCQEVRHLYDTPENQLLKYVIERLGECLRMVPQVVRAGGCYFGAAGNFQRTALATAKRLEKMEMALNRFRRNIYLHQVSLPSAINEVHLLRSETSRAEEYADVAQLYRRYRKIITMSQWHEVAQIGQRVLPLPERVDAEGEPWINLGVAVIRSQFQKIS